MFPMSKGLASCAVVAALSSPAGAQGLVIQKHTVGDGTDDRKPRARAVRKHELESFSGGRGP